MVTDSKILTVSYGTFSCTLEGFDDPFNTMRSIAEYFRDLAADDRYFGAEPPTPDPQMLQSIAEREIQRRVETKMDENGMTLRQVEGGPHADIAAPVAQPTATTATIKKGPTAKAVAPSHVPAPQPHVAAAPAAEDTAPRHERQTPSAPTAAAVASLTPAAEGSIAEKLARIRAAVAKRDDAPFAEDQHAADAFGTTISGTDVDTVIVDQPLVDTADVSDQTPVEDEVDLSAVMDASSPEPDAEVEPIVATPDEDVAHDIIDEARQAATTNDADDTSGIETSIDATDERVAAPDMPDMDPNLAADIAEASDTPDEVEDDIVAQTAPQDPLTRVRARVIKIRRADYEAEVAARADVTDQPEKTTDAQPEIEDVIAFDTDALTFDDASNDVDDTDFDANDVLVDFAADADDVDNAEYIEDLDDTDTSAADIASVLRRELGSTTLSDDDEDDLMRELADVAAQSVDAEIITDPIVADAPDDARDDSQTLDNVAALLGDNDVEDAPLVDDAFDDHGVDHAETDREATRNVFATSADDTMSRILDETEREMEKDDTSRRRSAIAHLKAAVMSKRADRDAGDEAANDDDDQNVYRDDLASIVRPTRPERVKTTRRDLPPLMLVSEQRIDTPKDMIKGADISPVRPRRISAAAVALREESDVHHDMAIANATGFADYAETMGAQGLSELLEAATAYANHVEGKDTVSRPQIMRLAMEAMPEDQPLEDRLRSFGQLLRQGKIKKIARGQFQVSDASRFKPETRAHG